MIAMDGTNWFSSFTIDKGSKEGIKKGMNVIAGSGLVGIVTDVGPNFAKVRSIIDDSSNVSSMVLTTKDNFNVGGSLKSMNQDKVLPFTELRDEDDKVKVGDPVVTSYVSLRHSKTPEKRNCLPRRHPILRQKHRTIPKHKNHRSRKCVEKLCFLLL